jgi:hypothetical protein
MGGGSFIRLAAVLSLVFGPALASMTGDLGGAKCSVASSRHTFEVRMDFDGANAPDGSGAMRLIAVR